MPQFLQGFGLCLYRKLTGLGSIFVLLLLQLRITRNSRTLILITNQSWFMGDSNYQQINVESITNAN